MGAPCLTVLNILVVVPGGVDRDDPSRRIPALVALLRRIAQRHRVVVVALGQHSRPSVYRFAGCHVIDLAWHAPTWRDLPRQLWAAAWACKRLSFQPHVVHAIWLGLNGSLATALAARWRAPLVASLGGGELVHLPDIGFGSHAGLVSPILSGITLRRACRVSAGSHVAAAAIARDTAWIPLGIETEGTSGRAEEPPALPRRLVQVADLRPVKDPTLMLETVAVLRSSGLDVVLDHVGQDTLDGAVQRRALALGLGAGVTFHGKLPNHALPALYRRAHAFLQTSRFESQGVAVLEAAAHGVPTVGTAVGLLPELAPGAAVATTSRHPETLAAHVAALLADSPRRRRLGLAARAWALAHDADWTADQVDALYREAASQSRRATAS